MKKLLLCSSIAAIIGLSGCGNSDKEDISKDLPFVRVAFDPSTSDINIPNDLLMLSKKSLFDFTLATEGNETFDGANPQHALSMLDGWSTSHPFQIRVMLAQGVDIDIQSVGARSIRLFEATQALLGTSAACQAIAAEQAVPGVPCELGEELQYGVDFETQYTPGTGAITVIPLKPLKPAQGYMLVVTSNLKDTEGRAVKGSTSWELARQDVKTNPMSSADELQLQTLINSLVNVMKPVGLSAEDIPYAAYFSTQSTISILAQVKQMQIGSYAQALQAALTNGATADEAQRIAVPYLPSIVTSAPRNGMTAFEFLIAQLLPAEQLSQLKDAGLNTCAGLLAALGSSDSSSLGKGKLARETFDEIGILCATKRFEGTVDLPYYLNPAKPLTDWWRAACTSGATLNSLGAEKVTALISAGNVGPNNALCQSASNGQLYDLDLSSLGIEDPHNITKVNPLPEARGRNEDDPNTVYNEAGTETLNVHFTVPNEALITVLSAASNGVIKPVTKPKEGWPVVVFQHGVGGSKEDVLAMATTLSLAGFASVGIDHPLHGEREFTLANGDVVGASTHLAVDFMNLASILTARDNIRQSIVDVMGLRLSLNAIIDTTGAIDLDLSNVHFIGQSLGAIVGSGAIGLANQNLPDAMSTLNEMYHFNSAVLNVPAGGISSFLLVSANFGPFIKGTLLAISSEEFVAFRKQIANDKQMAEEEATGLAFVEFEGSLDATTKGKLNEMFSKFDFAAQTILDSADPINYGALTASNTPTLMQLLVGGGTNDDGSTGLTDQVNPVFVPNIPLAGGEPLAKNIMGLTQVVSTTTGSGVVEFNAGEHPSLLISSPSVKTMNEMQKQAVAFFGTDGETIVISDKSVVAN